MNRTDLIVIGGGLAGLTAAFTAAQKGLSVRLLEKSSRTGGVIRSEFKEGFLLEHGPNTVPLNQELWDLIRALGLEGRMLLADHKIPRYILHGDQFHPVPLSPTAFFGSGLLSLGAKIRLLREPFIGRAPHREESLDAFVRRRLGAQVAERLLAPFVSGVWAGDPHQLSADASFPTLTEWEATHGSLLKGAIRSGRKKTGLPKGLVSFKGGLEILVQKLRDVLETQVKTQTAVHSLEKINGWTATTDSGEYSADRVLIAAPAAETADLIAPLHGIAADALRDIPYAPLAVVHLGFNKSSITSNLRGFGFLCDPAEGSPILGAVFNSHFFPDRAPEGCELFTVFIGGMGPAPTQPLITTAMTELRQRLNITEAPLMKSLTAYSRAIPQYTLGHRQRMEALAELEKQNRGLKIIGNIRGGISVGDVVKAAVQAIPPP